MVYLDARLAQRLAKLTARGREDLYTLREFGAANIFRAALEDFLLLPYHDQVERLTRRDSSEQ